MKEKAEKEKIEKKKAMMESNDDSDGSSENSIDLDSNYRSNDSDTVEFKESPEKDENNLTKEEKREAFKFRKGMTYEQFQKDPFGIERLREKKEEQK
jgi:hypothetical protein